MALKNEIWEEVKVHFRQIMNEVSYETFIASAKPLDIVDDDFYIEVPGIPHKMQYDNYHGNTIEQIAKERTGRNIHVKVILPGEYNELVVKEDLKNNFYSIFSQTDRSIDLNPKFTFASFVVGDGSRMAHAAALSVADHLGILYNPLFIYGGTGLGKTHLLHAIGNEVHRSNPQIVIRYVSTEMFTDEYIFSIQSGKMEQFKAKYRKVDLLMVDDIQFLTGKTETQNEFFHTFEELWNNGKQIVLTSDRTPSELKKLAERLVSRFQMGLITDIVVPDLETRVAILRKKAESYGLDIAQDVLRYIAEQIFVNVRELEGALKRVQAYSVINNCDITIEVAHQALMGITGGKIRKTKVDVAEIIEVVSKYYAINPSDIKGKRRVKGISVPRQIAMFLSRELTNLSLPRIGKAFDGKDHTTVMYAHKKISESVLKDEFLANDIQILKKQLGR
ncbi:MAG: chromosomal replication initiator protein DnaA [Streptococcaceae bacterium]|jgi:chromosomal replication initiator protein|nr:chromosomal replication initiator protein DnaA [Streptococcaceae bacterium]